MNLRAAGIVGSWPEYWEGNAALWHILARAAQRLCKGQEAAAQGRGMSKVGEAVRAARLAYMAAFRVIKTALVGEG